MKFKMTDLKEYRKQIIIGLTILFLMLSGSFYLVHASSISNEMEKTENIEKEETVPETIVLTEETVLIDIKGAVVNPGVYQLTVGSSVKDAINMAGGILENANTNVINLSKRLVDEMVIIVYTNEEVESYKKDPEVLTEFVYIEIPCECPDTMNDACIEKKEENNVKENLISINTATKEELMTLSGIGESKAEAIITYREKNDGFKAIEDIMNVSGIGETAFEKIKEQITV